MFNRTITNCINVGSVRSRGSFNLVNIQPYSFITSRYIKSAPSFICPHKTILDVSVNAYDESDTESIARTIAKYVSIPGMKVLLYGDLGVGKTAFARGFIRKITNMTHLTVNSPTFTIDVTYINGDLKIHHMDLYRIQPLNLSDGSREFPDVDVLNLDHSFKNDICIIEWPDRLHNTQFMPDSYVRVFIDDQTSNESNDDLFRQITISIVGKDLENIGNMLCNELKEKQTIFDDRKNIF